jgi:ElaB/YqjD/DUF883 family membrane-anchored ribosome-binding protein
MESTAPSNTSILGLVRTLTDDVKTFFCQEIELAKAENWEKLATFARKGVMLAVGGLVTYAGFIVFLIGLGWLIAWALQKAGLQPVLAGFIGLTAVGLLVVAAGAALLLKGLKALSKESLAPQRRIQTVQKMKGAEAHTVSVENSEPVAKLSSKEIQARVESTERRMGETLDELGRRLSPHHINAQVKRRIRENPYKSGLLALGAGLLSGLFLRRGAHRSELF